MTMFVPNRTVVLISSWVHESTTRSVWWSCVTGHQLIRPTALQVTSVKTVPFGLRRTSLSRETPSLSPLIPMKQY